MSRFDAAAGRLADSWEFGAPTVELKHKVWRGPGDDEVRTFAEGEQQYLTVRKAGMRLHVTCPTKGTGERLIALLGDVAGAIGDAKR